MVPDRLLSLDEVVLDFLREPLTEPQIERGIVLGNRVVLL